MVTLDTLTVNAPAVTVNDVTLGFEVVLSAVLKRSVRSSPMTLADDTEGPWRTWFVMLMVKAETELPVESRNGALLSGV